MVDRTGGTAALTASRALATDASGNIEAQTTTKIELGYVNGATSSLQTQLNAKAGTGTTNTFSLAQTFSEDVIIGATKKLRLDGSASGDTYFYESGANEIRWVVGGVTVLNLQTVQFAIPGGIHLNLDDASNILIGSSTGTKIGTATTQKIGFWNATPIVRPARPTDAATIITTGTALGIWA